MEEQVSKENKRWVIIGSLAGLLIVCGILWFSSLKGAVEWQQHLNHIQQVDTTTVVTR